MPSPLETFFLLFQSNAKDVKKDVDDTTQAVDNLADANANADTQAQASAASQVQAQGQVAGATNQSAQAANLSGVAAAEAGTAAVEAGHKTVEVQGKVQDAIKATVAENALAADGWMALGTIAGAVLVTLAGVAATINGAKQSYQDLLALSDKARGAGFGDDAAGYSAVTQTVQEDHGDVGKATSELTSFNHALEEAHAKSKSAAGKGLAAIGVSAVDANGKLKDTYTALLDVAGGLQKVGSAQQQATLRGLGIRDPTLQALLLSGKANLSDRFGAQRGSGLVTNEQVKAARDLKDAFSTLHDTVSGFFNQMVGDWAPALTKFIDRMNNFARWLREHGELIKGFGVGAVAALALVVAFLWGAYIPAWTAAAVAVVAATWPILAVIAALAVFALVWEDVTAFMRGQPSLIGDLANKYKWFGDILRGIGIIWNETKKFLGEGFGGLLEGLKIVAEGVMAIFGPLIDILSGALTEGIKLLGTGIKVVFTEIWPAIKPFVEAVIEAGKIIAAMFSNLAKGFAMVFAAAFGAIVGGLQAIDKQFQAMMAGLDSARQGWEKALPGGGQPVPGLPAGKGALAIAAVTPVASRTSAAIAHGAHKPTSTHKTTTIKIDKVDVNTQATDADGMARAASGALTDQLRRATDQYDNGVER